MTTKASPERVDATTAGDATKKRETFDPYRFGRIQFSTQFFRRLISTPLPEVPDEDLLREEDVRLRASATVSARADDLSKNAVTIAPVRPPLAPRRRRGRRLLLLAGVALGTFALLLLGLALVDRKRAAIAPPSPSAPSPSASATSRTEAFAPAAPPAEGTRRPPVAAAELRSPPPSESARPDPTPERSPLPKTRDSGKKTTPEPSPPPRGNEAFFEAE